MRWGCVAVVGVGMAVATTVMAGCESCSFTFGARMLRATVHIPAGYDDAKIVIGDDEPPQTEWISPGILEATWLVPSQSDGPRKCEYPGGTIEVSHSGCETQRVEFGAIRSGHGEKEDFEPNIVLECEPSGVGEPGHWCQRDVDCGAEGFTCDPELEVCLAPTCAAASDCGAPDVLICDPDTRSCITPVCSRTEPCGGGETCVFIDRSIGAGVCRPQCVMYEEDTCLEGTQCWRRDASYTQSAADSAWMPEPYCYPVGSSGPEAECAPSVLDTACVAGYGCLAGECRRLCDLFEAGPGGPVGCATQERCAAIPAQNGEPSEALGATCTSEPVDPAQIGEACASAAFAICADDGERARGICDADGTCRRVCSRLDALPPGCDACDSATITVNVGGARKTLDGFGVCS